MNRERMDLELAVDNAFNFYEGQKTIPKKQAEDLINIHKRVPSSSFWNYVDSLGDFSFRAAVENILNHQYD